MPSNLGVAHRGCNSEKGAKTAKEFEKEKARPGLKRRTFRRKPLSLEKKAELARARESREFDQTTVWADEVDPDDLF